jgi:ppGpp synthetase/RelA/SpoT-type nucleotidyltranferase
MSKKKQLTPAKHRHQIKAYSRVFDNYKTYAEVLKRILENACKVSFPEAIIQTRPKSISSFAEKAARKFDKYPDAVNQMTDLCGARVIVQTTEQVKAVRQFIEANFVIVEKDDKGVLLSEDRFGYRDMHYIVQLCPDRCRTLGVKEGERRQIDDRKAEIQVRTWVQHAWADTLHDRMYKNDLKVSAELVRTGNLQAALMEEGDRIFDQLANELDGLIANYTAFATKEQVKNEIKIQQLVLNKKPDKNKKHGLALKHMEADKDKKPGLALKLARLYAAIGDYQRVVNLLNPYAGIHDANRCELFLMLGYSLCKLHRGATSSVEYKRGLRFLEESKKLCGCKEVPFIPNLRKRESLHARVLVRLGWALEPILGEGDNALDYYQQAHEHEPSNPYYFAEMLGFEMHYSPTVNLSDSMRATIREAIKTCEQHALAGIEMPYACFTAGRLSLLLSNTEEEEKQEKARKPQTYDALGYCARGIRYCLEGTHCIPADIFDTEIQWLVRIHSDVKHSVERQRVIELLKLAKFIMKSRKRSVVKSAKSLPILIVAGGAASINAATIKKIRPLLRAALADFQGTVYAGGTKVGVPGCVGDVAHELARMKKKHFTLIGYLPRREPEHKCYEVQRVGEAFVPDLILRNWSDILSKRFNPKDVLLLGFGGGALSAIEYKIALGLGASVGVVTGTGGTADILLQDGLWSKLPNLNPLPFDSMTVRAFVLPEKRKFGKSALVKMAKEFHARYVAGNTKDLPDSLKPWDKLNDGYKEANREQAAYAVQILETTGFSVRKVKNPVIFRSFTDEEVEFMAKLEHGRWNVERLRHGWRYGPRDDSKKLHNCLLPWSELPDGPKGVRKYDRNAVRAFPEILAKAGLEVYRPKKTAHRGRKFNKNKNRPRHRYRTKKTINKDRKG